MATVYSYSPLIRLSDLKYPLYFSDLRAENPNVMFGATPPEETVAMYGYALVHDTVQPSGDVVTEGSPQPASDGLWYQTWVTRSFTDEERAANLLRVKNDFKSQAMMIYDSDVINGTVYQYNGVNYPVPLGTGSLCVLLTMKEVATAAEDDETFPFQAGSGKVLTLSKADVLALCAEIFQTSYTLSKTYWGYLQSVDSAASADAIPALPDTFVGYDEAGS